MVSLHGITGDPISYMDEYAEQVEEYMKKCFPNVRGRARPFPGRTNNNNNNNNNSNKNNTSKSRPRTSATASPKPCEQQIQQQQHQQLRYPSQNVSPSSLLLPKFPFFNNSLGQNNNNNNNNNSFHEKSQEKFIPEIKVNLGLYIMI